MSFAENEFPKAGADLAADIIDMVESIRAIKGPLWCSAVLQSFNMVNGYHMQAHVQCGEAPESLRKSVNELAMTNIVEFMSFAIAAIYPHAAESSPLHAGKLMELRDDMDMLRNRQREHSMRIK